MFRFFVLWHLVQDSLQGNIPGDTFVVVWEEISDVSNPPEFSFRLLQWERSPHESGGLVFSGNCFRSFNVRQSVLEYAELHHNVFYIVDSTPPMFVPETSGWRTLQVSSPCESRWKEFQKQSGAIMSYMPTWTYEELGFLASVIRPQMTADDVRDRFHYIGGSARMLVAHCGKKLPKKYIDDALDETGAEVLWNMATVDTREESLSDRLLAFVTASPGAAATAMQIGDDGSTWQIPSLVRRPVLRADHIAAVEEGQYGIPPNHNFPVIDAVIGRSIMVQITIRAEHSINCVAAEALWRHWVAGGVAPPVEFLWVVPLALFPSFPVQKLHRFDKVADAACRAWLQSLRQRVVAIDVAALVPD